jgi:S-adenosylmethionine:diacylglycerol 3-amino-3-carboxypropyl transferase
MARFERYLSKLNGLALNIIGKKKMMRLFDFEDVKLQKHHFDQHLASRRLKLIFNIAFHPGIYKNRGMDKQGLTHSGKRDIAAFFFSRFRDFCTSTLARKNYFLQFTFYNRILFNEALPEYLKEEGNQLLRKRMDQLTFHHQSVSLQIQYSPAGHYNKFALSNVGDWLSREEITDLFQIIGEKSAEHGKLLLRYIHFAHPLPGHLAHMIKTNPQLGQELESLDRYPFYSLIPMEIQL